MRGTGLLLHETCLRIASEAIRILAFADDHADDEPGDRENQHLRLEFGVSGCIVSREVKQSDEAELGGGQAEAGAVETMTDRRHDHRYEQEVERSETIQVLAAAIRTEGDADDDQVESAFRNNRKHLA